MREQALGGLVRIARAICTAPDIGHAHAFVNFLELV